jgi:flagellar hook-associated protein 1 FlgK
MSAHSISNTAFSALQNAQAGVELTAQNINGQMVTGYTRRRLDAGTSPVLSNNAPALGSGVSVSGFSRDWSALLQQQRVNQGGVTAYHGAVADGLAALDSAAANPALALDAPVNNFFTSLATLARSPGDASALAAVKAQGTALLSAARQFQDSLATVQSNARQSLAAGVDQLNRIGSELALINRDIATSQSAGGVGPSPATLDRRDALLLQAGGLVGGDIGLNSDGQAYVFIDGQPLVNGDAAGQLQASSADATSPLALTMRFGVPGRELPPVTVALRTSALQGSVGGELVLAADPSLLLQPGGEPDPQLAAFTDLFAAAAGQTPAGASQLTRTLALLGAFNAKSSPVAADSATLDAALGQLAAQSNNTDPVLGGHALQGALLDSWRAFQGQLGAQVSVQQSRQTASAAIEARLSNDFQSQSGVNLDEEAANLMRYQQAYSAASKLLQTNATLLDGLLAVVGR